MRNYVAKIAKFRHSKKRFSAQSSVLNAFADACTEDFFASVIHKHSSSSVR